MGKKIKSNEANYQSCPAPNDPSPGTPCSSSGSFDSWWISKQLANLATLLGEHKTECSWIQHVSGKPAHPHLEQHSWTCLVQTHSFAIHLILGWIFCCVVFAFFSCVFVCLYIHIYIYTQLLELWSMSPPAETKSPACLTCAQDTKCQVQHFCCFLPLHPPCFKWHVCVSLHSASLWVYHIQETPPC